MPLNRILLLIFVPLTLMALVLFFEPTAARYLLALIPWIVVVEFYKRNAKFLKQADMSATGRKWRKITGVATSVAQKPVHTPKGVTCIQYEILIARSLFPPSHYNQAGCYREDSDFVLSSSTYDLNLNGEHVEYRFEKHNAYVIEDAPGVIESASLLLNTLKNAEEDAFEKQVYKWMEYAEPHPSTLTPAKSVKNNNALSIRESLVVDGQPYTALALTDAGQSSPVEGSRVYLFDSDDVGKRPRQLLVLASIVALVLSLVLILS